VNYRCVEVDGKTADAPTALKTAEQHRWTATQGGTSRPSQAADWQAVNPRRTICGVSRRTEWILAGSLSGLAVGLTIIPYLLAADIVSGKAVFGGFLIHPLDGFSYLAKMRQGLDGSWLFRLPYTAAPGAGAFTFVYLLLLGHLAGWLGAPLLGLYHGARVIAALIMFLMAFGFYEVILPDRRARWLAFLLTLFCSGVGWLGLPTGFFATDLWMPESIPFLSAYANAHFPLASACILGGALAITRTDWSVLRRSLTSAVCGFVIGAVLPFLVLGLGAVLAAWNAWEIGRKREFSNWKQVWQEHRVDLFPSGSLVAAAGPWIVYDFWLIRTHPALATWNAQNRTPSPVPFDYLLGFGLVLLLAVIGVIMTRPDQNRNGRMLLSWVIVTALLLYAPVNVQRRLAQGIFFPMAALAGLGLVGIGKRWRNLFAPIVFMTFLLSVPSNITVVLAGVDGVSQLSPRVVLSLAEADAYQWTSNHVPPGSLILAGETAGNRLPAFAGVRVVYGHPFETPDATAERDWMESMYAWSADADTGLDQLTARGVSYVYFSREERHIGTPTWLDRLPVVFEEGDVSIRKVSAR
jgi:hypothetical protein